MDGDKPALNAAAPALPSLATNEKVFERPPAPGMALEIRPGLFWHRLPLREAPNHVNVWLLSDPEGWTIVDAGADQDPVRALWEQTLARLGEPAVARLLLTHAHYDHVEIAGWLSERLDAPITMTREEFFIGHAFRARPDHATFWSLMKLAGCPEELAGAVIEHRETLSRRYRTLPMLYHRIVDGHELEIGGRRWTVMTGGGHSIEQAALHCAEDRLLIAADHVLPRSAPSVPIYSFERGSDPLGELFAMHERWLALDPETLVLPSHGRPYLGLHERVRELRAFREDRLAAIAEACGRGGLTAHEALIATAPRVPTRRFMPGALSEMMAHLWHLERRGALVGARNEAGALVFRAV